MGVDTAIVLHFPELRAFPEKLGKYPSSLIAFSTFMRVSSFTLPSLFTTLDTVIKETPAFFATSFCVTKIFPTYFKIAVWIPLAGHFIFPSDFPFDNFKS